MCGGPQRIVVLIFSRDRAMQLDATLRSFFLHCQDPESVHLYVLYRATNVLHATQYTELAREYAEEESVRFVKQENFRADVLRLLSARAGADWLGLFGRFAAGLAGRSGLLDRLRFDRGRTDYALLLVDDNIIVRDFSLRGVCAALGAHADAVGFSLRLGTNTTYCYSRDRSQEVPPCTRVGEGILKFDWTNAEWDFGYPLEISSSIYRLGELIPLLRELVFENPNSLESHMAGRAPAIQGKYPYLLCFEQSATFCNALNRVQDVYVTNRAGTAPEYESERLTQMFAAGYRIRVDAYSGFVPLACHQEVKLVFEKHGEDS